MPRGKRSDYVNGPNTVPSLTRTVKVDNSADMKKLDRVPKMISTKRKHARNNEEPPQGPLIEIVFENNKLECYWNKPVKWSILQFESKEVADTVREAFSSGKYKVSKHFGEFHPRTESGHDCTKLSVWLGDLPEDTKESHIRAAIPSQDQQPKEIILSKCSYRVSRDIAIAKIVSLCNQVGSVQLINAGPWRESRGRNDHLFCHFTNTITDEVTQWLSGISLPFTNSVGALRVRSNPRAVLFATPGLLTAAKDKLQPLSEAIGLRGMRIVIQDKVYQHRRFLGGKPYQQITISGSVYSEIAAAIKEIEEILTCTPFPVVESSSGEEATSPLDSLTMDREDV